jgi:exonuclease I
MYVCMYVCMKRLLYGRTGLGMSAVYSIFIIQVGAVVEYCWHSTLFNALVLSHLTRSLPKIVRHDESNIQDREYVTRLQKE